VGSSERIGPSAYRFKHIGLCWASADSNPPATSATDIGPAIIRATVMHNRARNAYEGTFALDRYEALLA
jgi:hypothetical protein